MRITGDGTRVFRLQAESNDHYLQLFINGGENTLHTEKIFLNLVNRNQIGNYNTNLVCINKIQKRFLCLYNVLYQHLYESALFANNSQNYLYL